MNTRIVNGAKYFYNMKPSQFGDTGGVKPNRWRELMEFMKLILEEEKKDSDNNDDEVVKIAQVGGPQEPDAVSRANGYG
jgi:hypothetical protein